MADLGIAGTVDASPSDALVQSMIQMRKRRLAGPPGQIPEDARLDALKSNQAAKIEDDAAAEAARPPDLKAALAPLVVAQIMDLISTEKPFGFMAHTPGGSGSWSTSEANPLPGMQSPAGRLGWGAGETLLAALLTKRAPAIGRAVVIGGNVAHNAMIGQNANTIRELDAMNRLQGQR